MKILNVGSMNVDNVYSVSHFVEAGETLSSSKLEKYCGGKGLNQSAALARAGAQVYHAGLIGTDGDMLLDACTEYGVHTDYIRKLPVPSGHTVIQVDASGQNCILLYGGTNGMFTREFIDEVLSDFEGTDLLVLQNEINELPYLIDRAYEKEMRIVLNPSPYDHNLEECDLSKVWLLLMNEIEGKQCTGFEEPQDILDELERRFPRSRTVLTLGKDGAWYCGDGERVFQDIFPVDPLDTTAAGDTFTGFFTALFANGADPAEALRVAAMASSIAVTRKGAAPSIPTIREVLARL